MDNSLLPIFKLMKFCAVGASGMFFDFIITFLLKEKIRINKFAANSSGFIAAASNNYMLNRIWTFQSSNSNIAGEFSEFIGVSIVGLLVNNTFLYIFHEKLKMNFYAAKLSAIFLTTIWNFAANNYITFG